jgi:hypothetical protein
LRPPRRQDAVVSDDGMTAETFQHRSGSRESGANRGESTGMMHIGRFIGRGVLSLTAAAVLLLAAVPSASATKYFDSFFGSQGALGGQVNQPRDIAVNLSSVDDGNAGAFDGWVYVVDSSNHRISVFDADKAFRFAIGRDVVQTGGTGDTSPVNRAEKCVVASECKVGVTGAPAQGGELNNPQAVVIDQSSGNFFVRDRGNNRVQEFTAAGVFVRAWGFNVDALAGAGQLETCFVAAACQAGAAGSGAGQFGASTQSTTGGIVIDPNSGNVMVIDPTNRRILEYAVPASPLLPVVFVGAFGSSAQFSATNFPRDLAIASDGVVYATTSQDAGTLHSVARYDTATGEFLNRIESGNGTVLGGGNPSVNGLDVDPATDHLLVARQSATGVLEFDLSGKPETVDESHLVDAHGIGIFSTSNQGAQGMGLDPDSGEILLSSVVSVAGGIGNGHRVLVFDDNGVDPPPSIDLLPPTDVECATATLQATINPNGPTGFATSYRFEVSKNGVSWTAVAADQLVGADGDGGTPVFIDDQATGLEPNTSYRVRVVTTRSPSAGRTVSAELTLVTDPCPPEVQTDGAQHVTDTSAQLTGRINPGGLSTSYFFEWGDDNYGNRVPVPAGDIGSGGLTQRVVQAIAGLEPERHYHFRLCAQNALAPTPVCGADRQFATRSGAAAAPTAGRSYEMVTSPDKVLRRGGERGLGAADYSRYQAGLVSSDGQSVAWNVFAGVTDPDAGNQFAHDRAWEIRRRTPAGWRGEAVSNIAPLIVPSAGDSALYAISADLNTQTWNHNGFYFPSGSKQSTRVMGDSGGPRGAGWYPWLDPAWFSGDYGVYSVLEKGLIDDDGDRMVRFHGSASTPMYRELRDPSGVSPLSLGQVSGSVPWLSTPPLWRPEEIVHRCTGIGGEATEIPARSDNGTPGDLTDDMVGAQLCAAGSLTSRRGATAGAGSVAAASASRLQGTAITAMSDSGDRVFFMSPDPDTSLGVVPGDVFAASPNGQTACAAAAVFGTVTFTGANTECPAQVYVRQYDDQGQATVRWISRAEDGLFGSQQIGAFGSGASFEGASRDGRVVYFRTDAPLTADDPNDGESITTTASHHSWDLYRYELPADRNADPADGTLTRVSGGPDGDADPNTNCAVVATSGADSGGCSGTTVSSAPNGAGAVVRFMSDDGQRVYLATASPIAGASNAPPAGNAATTVGGDKVNDSSRNLYLYDANKTGAAAYEFIAQVPFSSTVSSRDACASFNWIAGGPPRIVQPLGDEIGTSAINCVHGTSSGDAVVFETAGQLTADDVDDAVDVYLYDADKDELTRLSGPPAGGGSPYPCLTLETGAPTAYCNADLGMGTSGATSASSPESVGLAGLRRFNVAEDSAGGLEAVFFQSRLAFVAGDVNGAHMDVYEWRDGRLSLVSPGNAAHSAFLTGSSPDGRDVFFWTEQRISAWEIDEDGDLYDARVGGGFPDPVIPPPVCGVLDDGCQGSGSVPVGAGVQTTPGGGNVSPTTRAAISVRVPGAKARRRAARRGVLALRVGLGTAGRVRAVATAKVASRRGKRVRRRVASTRLDVRRPGAVTLKLRLSRVARRELRSGRALRVSVRVSMRDARSRAIAVLLQRPGR